MTEKPLTNKELIKLLGCMKLEQTYQLPVEFKDRQLPSFKQLMALIQERLAVTLLDLVDVNEDGEIVLSRQQQQELAAQVKKELKVLPPQKPERDFLEGYEDYRFTKDLLRGTYFTHKSETDYRRIGCITVRLERFIPPGVTVEQSVNSLLAGIGACLNIMVRHGTWPLGVDNPKHIFWLIHQQIKGSDAKRLLAGKNLMLVIGQPQNMMNHIPFINKEDLVALYEQMKEVNQEYPGWIIQSDPSEFL